MLIFRCLFAFRESTGRSDRFENKEWELYNMLDWELLTIIHRGSKNWWVINTHDKEISISLAIASNNFEITRSSGPEISWLMCLETTWLTGDEVICRMSYGTAKAMGHEMTEVLGQEDHASTWPTRSQEKLMHGPRDNLVRKPQDNLTNGQWMDTPEPKN